MPLNGCINLPSFKSCADTEESSSICLSWSILAAFGTTNVVKNPSYRGITQSFWHNLIKVGNNNTRRTLGTANCGKGEPNQSIFVGHSTPACVFKDVEVFGGIK